MSTNRYTIRTVRTVTIPARGDIAWRRIFSTLPVFYVDATCKAGALALTVELIDDVLAGDGAGLSVSHTFTIQRATP